MSRHFFFRSTFWGSFCSFAFIIIIALTDNRVFGADYTDAAAMSALDFARASYCSAAVISNWTCAACADNPGLKDVLVLSDFTEKTQGFVGVKRDAIVVSFRGTQNLANWINNLDFIHTKYPNATCAGCSVHKGFLRSFYSLRGQMWDHLLQLAKRYPRLPLLVTGHSLGGAMAVLAAAEIVSQSHTFPVAPHVELYTFGAPRVGNAKFAAWFSTLFCMGGHKTYRITHKRDIVPRIVFRMFGYIHTPHELWFNSDSSVDYKNCTDVKSTECPVPKVGEDGKCSMSTYLYSIADHLLYLGKSTGCLPDGNNKELEAAATARISPELEWMLFADHAYMHTRKGRKVILRPPFANE